MISKRETTLNLSEGVYLNFLKESMPGRQHKKPLVEEVPPMPEKEEEEDEDKEE